LEAGHESQIRVGTCAWSFDDWRGFFYPRALAQNQWLEYYAQHLGAVEVDSTFYHIPSRRVVEQWLARTPEHFVFTCKLPRAITHEAKLRDCRKMLETFLDAIEPMRERLGSVLIQLPPAFAPEPDETALRRFIMELPKRFRFAIEFRHAGWHLPRITRFLAENGVSWAWTDVSPLDEQNEGPFEFLPQTADFLYIRLLGDLRTKYQKDGTRVHRYGRLMWPREPAIENWALKIQAHIDECRRIFLFANNHYEGFSPATCQRLAKKLGIDLRLPPPEIDPSAADPQLPLL
jgi:uncharacterized protein YecE (DUF72 family)